MKKIITLLASFLFLLSACAPKGPATLTVMTHSSFAASEEVIKTFEDANNVKVAFVR
jgi:ABC-type thiamine transport system substrate-binding protein